MQLNSANIGVLANAQCLGNTGVNWPLWPGDYLGGKGKWTVLSNSSAKLKKEMCDLQAFW